jgi:hypothetical protein
MTGSGAGWFERSEAIGRFRRGQVGGTIGMCDAVDRNRRFLRSHGRHLGQAMIAVDGTGMGRSLAAGISERLRNGNDGSAFVTIATPAMEERQDERKGNYGGKHASPPARRCFARGRIYRLKPCFHMNLVSGSVGPIQAGTCSAAAPDIITFVTENRCAYHDNSA